MVKYKRSIAIFLLSTIAFAIMHFTLLFTVKQALHYEDLILAVVPYGFPIFMAFLARGEVRQGRPIWKKTGGVMAVLFALCYFAMITRVSLAYAFDKANYFNVYFNEPLLFSVGMIPFAVLWALTKGNSAKQVPSNAYQAKEGRNKNGQSRMAKFLSVLIVLALIAMVVHCGWISVVELMRQMDKPLSTSFPWWVMPVLLAFAYFAVIGVLFALRWLCNRADRKKLK